MKIDKRTFLRLASIFTSIWMIVFVLNWFADFDVLFLILYTIIGLIASLGVLGIWVKQYNKLIDEEKIKTQNKFKRFIDLDSSDSIEDQIVKRLSQLNQNLIFTQNQLNLMMTYIGPGVILIDNNRDIIFINDVASKLLQVIDTKDVFSYQARIRHIGLKKHIEKVFIRKQVISEEFLVDKQHILLKTIPLESEEDLKIMVLVEDLTEKRALELTKRDFFTHAGHELKTPIAVLKGFAELIYHGVVSSDEDLRQVAKNMVKHTDLMANFVEDMLALSRLETIHEKPTTSLPLQSVLNDVIDDLKELAKQKNIDILVDSDNIIYQADIIDMVKLFKNLIENAIKYSVDGKQVKISLKQKQNVELIVQDEGIGIPSEELGRIFERFYRVSQVRDIPGTGLGLAIVKHIVQKYGGRIKVESIENKGTTFKIAM